ncbi:EAL domain-containing protein [Castellaniella sp. GW247-6E4]|uniref:EAL domain-containing protein n=1 Tax=Castellaniella sp. GW247-6E4 TaxID=3140380 RepID=UPI003314E3F9
MPETLLRHALERDEFRLAYQPIVDLRTRRWLGVEALIRWPGTGIGPEVFIPIAEQIGLIRDITRRVCALAARDCVAAPAAIARLSINLSAADIRTMDTARILETLLRALGDGMRLSVELTERSLLEPTRCGPVIQAVRAMGIQVVIDDFGAGYANLQSLAALELDGIKIDRSLSQKVGTSPAASLIIRHVCALARALGLSIVAEGVETETQASLLYGHGIRQAQGWLFGHPVPIDELGPNGPTIKAADAPAAPPAEARRAAPSTDCS